MKGNAPSKLPTKLHFSLGEELVSSLSEKVHLKFACGFDGVSDYIHKFFPIFWLNPRPISNHQLNTLLYLHLGPIYLVVFKGSYCFHMRYPILRGASRLDAFSVYPVPT